MKSVLVTGADGSVGKRLIQKLVQEGITPSVLVRTEKEKSFFDAHRVPMFVGSAKEAKLVAASVQGKEAVIHLIGTFQPQNGDTLDGVNNALSYKLHEAAHENRVQKFIFLSAYGASVAVHNPFLVSKGNAEIDIMQGEVPYVILRSAPIYAQDNALGALLREAVRNKKAPLIGTGQQKLQPIYVDDVVAYLYQALIDPKARQQVLEIGGPDKVSYEELIARVSEVSGQPIALKKIPSFLKSFFPPIKVNGELLSQELLDFYSRENFVSNERANSVIPVPLTSLCEGLKKIL